MSDELDELRIKLDEALRQAAYWEGRANAEWIELDKRGFEKIKLLTEEWRARAIVICECDPWEGGEESCPKDHEHDVWMIARLESIYLWSDLEQAVNHAANGQWSMGCEDIAERIKALGTVVGAVPWEHVSVELLRSGLYARIYGSMGIEYEPIDWDRVAKVEEMIAKDAAKVTL